MMQSRLMSFSLAAYWVGNYTRLAGQRWADYGRQLGDDPPRGKARGRYNTMTGKLTGCRSDL